MAGQPRRSIRMSTSRRRPVTGEKSLAGAVAVVAGATRGAASLGRSEKLVRRSIARDEACVPTAPRTIVLKQLKRQLELLRTGSEIQLRWLSELRRKTKHFLTQLPQTKTKATRTG
jgi:hypothetical protein